MEQDQHTGFKYQSGAPSTVYGWLSTYGNHLFEQSTPFRCHRCGCTVHVHDGRDCTVCKQDCVTGQALTVLQLNAIEARAVCGKFG